MFDLWWIAASIWVVSCCCYTPWRGSAIIAWYKQLCELRSKECVLYNTFPFGSFVRKLSVESFTSSLYRMQVPVTASCLEGGKTLLFLYYIMTAALHYHAAKTCSHPPPPAGGGGWLLLGYDITYYTLGLVPNMESAWYSERRGMTWQSRR